MLLILMDLSHQNVSKRNWIPCKRSSTDSCHLAEEEDEDNMEEIDTDNIITSGRRTRGKSIDFNKVDDGGYPDDDDDDDDDDFEEPDDRDAMEE